MAALKVGWKFGLSFLKSSWELSDYPIRIRQLEPVPELHGRSVQPFTWSAQIINWWVMAGHGYSRDEATRNLVESFDRRKATAEPLPRPGTRVPLVFASDDRIRQYEGPLVMVSDGRLERHEALVADFLDRILGLKYEQCI